MNYKKIHQKQSSIGKQKCKVTKMVEEKVIEHKKTDKKEKKKQKGVEWFHL